MSTTISPTIKSFVVPTRHPRRAVLYEALTVYAIIPTFRPQGLTLKLVEDLLRFHPTLRVYLVDDCSPAEAGSTVLFDRIRALGERVVLLRTPQNTLKAGALNYGLHYIRGREAQPDVILTLDDDVAIAPDTVFNLVRGLMEYDHVAAACSECRVLNKNKNLLTRFQGLEYNGFNAIRLADEGFFYGPLVMHGMLTAFKAKELFAIDGFTERHLIEDYDISARIKAKGWSVRAVLNATAWTEVPETLGDLWRQRARWSYGGITVVKESTSWLAVLQDLIGHGFFIVTVLLLDLLLFFRNPGLLDSPLAAWIIGLTLLQFAVWYGYQIGLMFFYKDRDIYDWLLRVSFFPEFIYGNLLALVLMGSYLFLSFTICKRALAKRSTRAVQWSVEQIGGVFHRLGYSEGWGTRTLNNHV